METEYNSEKFDQLVDMVAEMCESYLVQTLEEVQTNECNDATTTESTNI